MTCLTWGTNLTTLFFPPIPNKWGKRYVSVISVNMTLLISTYTQLPTAEEGPSRFCQDLGLLLGDQPLPPPYIAHVEVRRICRRRHPSCLIPLSMQAPWLLEGVVGLQQNPLEFVSLLPVQDSAQAAGQSGHAPANMSGYPCPVCRRIFRHKQESQRHLDFRPQRHQGK